MYNYKTNAKSRKRSKRTAVKINETQATTEKGETIPLENRKQYLITGEK
jgi:hypothetical protein